MCYMALFNRTGRLLANKTGGFEKTLGHVFVRSTVSLPRDAPAPRAPSGWPAALCLCVGA